MSCKKYHKYKENYSLNPSTCIYENSKYLESVADTSVTECDEIVTVMNNLSTKETNTTFTSTVFYYILHTFLLAIISLLIITIIFYHYAKLSIKF